jgi:MtN3 and saliva related transmembrane protein
MSPFPITALGYIAATLTTLSIFPQALKILRSGDTSAISLRMYALFTTGVAAWAIYGLCIRDGPVIVANGITLVPASVVLERKLRAVLGRDPFGRQKLGRRGRSGR